MRLTHQGLTHQGARTTNEDAYIADVYDNGALFAVADGLGGLPGGAWASYGFCQALKAHHPELIPALRRDPYQAMRTLFQQSAKHMLRYLTTNNQSDGRTTAAVAWLCELHVIAAHIGDSRIYYFSQDGKYWRSHDHSQAQYLVDQGIISEQVMAHHPSQAALLRSLGQGEDPEPAITLFRPLQGNERLVLCTDGFWEWASARRMDQISRVKAIQSALQAQFSEIMDQAGLTCDNITAQVIRAESGD